MNGKVEVQVYQHGSSLGDFKPAMLSKSNLPYPIDFLWSKRGDESLHPLDYFRERQDINSTN